VRLAQDFGDSFVTYFAHFLAQPGSPSAGLMQATRPADSAFEHLAEGPSFQVQMN
jgi:hypothetical protein